MSADKTTPLLLEALKQATSAPGERRLYRSGKLEGLFAGKTGTAGEAAALALQDGFFESVRSETKGKAVIEWVRATPKGVDFLAQHDSPVRAMDDLRAALATTKENMPEWVGQIRRGLHDLSERLTEEVQRVLRRLETLSTRVENSLRTAENVTPPVPAAAADAFPWALDAVAYLDRRRHGKIDGDCALPELFAAVRGEQPALTIADFHAGLLRLRDRGVLRLRSFDGPGELPEPEFALLEGAEMFYYAMR